MRLTIGDTLDDRISKRMPPNSRVSISHSRFYGQRRIEQQYPLFSPTLQVMKNIDESALQQHENLSTKNHDKNQIYLGTCPKEAAQLRVSILEGKRKTFGLWPIFRQ